MPDWLFIRPVSGPVSIPGPATAGRTWKTGYANWQSGEVESLVPVGSTPTSVTETIPWSNGKDAWVTTRKVMVRFHPGSLLRRSVGVLAARLLGKEEDRFDSRTDLSMRRAAGPTGRRLVCTQAIGVRFPGGPLK